MMRAPGSGHERLDFVDDGIDVADGEPVVDTGDLDEVRPGDEVGDDAAAAGGERVALRETTSGYAGMVGSTARTSSSKIIRITAAATADSRPA